MAAGTETEWVNLFPQRILDLSALETDLRAPLQDAVTTGIQDLWGSGGVLTAAATLTDTAGIVDLDANAVAYVQDGFRLVMETTDDGFQNVPYQATGAVTYQVGARYGQVPVGGSPGFDGTPGFGTWKEAIGFELVADSITNPGSTVVFDVSVALAAQMRWAGAGPSRPVTVWLNTPETSGSEIVAAGTLAHDGGGVYTITIAHEFGQAAPSTTPGDYTILVHGLEFAAAGLDANTAVFYFGTILNNAHTSSAQAVIGSLGALWTAFEVEHDNASGFHKDVTAFKITGRGTGLGGTEDLEIEGENVRIKDKVTSSTLAILATLAGSTVACQAEDASNDLAGITIDRDTLAVDLKSDTGTTKATKGIATGQNADAGTDHEEHRYSYDDPAADDTGYPSFWMELSPSCGGWTVTSTTAGQYDWRLHSKAYPRDGEMQIKNNHASTASNDAVFRRGLPSPFYNEEIASGAAVYHLLGLEVVFGAANTDQPIVELVEQAKDGLSESVKFTVTPTAVASVQTVTDVATPVDLDWNTNRYFLLWRPATIAAAGLSREIRSVRVRVRKRAVE